MSIEAASNADCRWALAVPTITDGSPARTIPIRCQRTTRAAPYRRRASTSQARKVRRAIARWDSYSSARTVP
ncbi:MAG: hypothetical protein ABSA15_07075 [Thermoplasmata archaeon]|jgi:hypothetical protein